MDQQAEPERRVPKRLDPHLLEQQLDGDRPAQQREDEGERERRELVERIAVGQHQAADMVRVRVDDQLTQAAAGVIADERHIRKPERDDEIRIIVATPPGERAPASLTGMVCEPSGQFGR